MKKKRSKKTIRKRQEAILKVADQLQKSGIDCSRRFIFVGGTQPERVEKLRTKRDRKD